MVLRLRGYFRVGVADSQKAAREPRFGFYEATWTQEVVRGAGGRASVMLPPVIMPLTAFVGAVNGAATVVLAVDRVVVWALTFPETGRRARGVAVWSSESRSLP